MGRYRAESTRLKKQTEGAGVEFVKLGWTRSTIKMLPPSN